MKEEAQPRINGKRTPVARTRAFRLGDLDPAQRKALYAETYVIYTSYKLGVDRATFERQFFSDDDSRVVLFYDEAGAIVGFSSAAVHPINHEGRKHAVVVGLIYIDTRFDGSRKATLHALMTALRFKLRAPWMPLAYMGVTTPASFRFAASMLSVTYPSWQGAPTPAPISALMQKSARLRGLTFVDEARWLVRILGASRNPERLTRSRSLQEDPCARFYQQHNPRFEEGVGLLVWVPLDVGNIGRALLRHFFGDPARRTVRVLQNGT